LGRPRMPTLVARRLAAERKQARRLNAAGVFLNATIDYWSEDRRILNLKNMLSESAASSDGFQPDRQGTTCTCTAGARCFCYALRNSPGLVILPSLELGNSVRMDAIGTDGWGQGRCRARRLMVLG